MRTRLRFGVGVADHHDEAGEVLFILSILYALMPFQKIVADIYLKSLPKIGKNIEVSSFR